MPSGWFERLQTNNKRRENEENFKSRYALTTQGERNRAKETFLPVHQYLV
jgi:hypothetical protein